VAVDAAGSLFIADYGNKRVRKAVFSTSSTLVLENIGAGNAGWYDVFVSNPYGSVNSIAVNVVIAPLVIPSAPTLTTGKSNFLFQLSGPAGSNYALQTSTNLEKWSSVSTSTIPASGTVNFTNAINNYNHCFYRVQLQ
jgi:hypothetical protein